MEPLEVKFTRPVWESDNGTTRGSFFIPIQSTSSLGFYRTWLSARPRFCLRRRNVNGLE